MMLKKLLPVSTWCVAALTFALSIGVQGGYSVTAGVLFLLSMSLIYNKPSWSSLDVDDKRLFYSFLFFFLSMALAVALDGFFIRGLDRPSRFILALPVLLLLLQTPGSKHWLWYGVVVGALLAFYVAVHERFFLNLARASGGHVAIMFGNTAMLLGLMSFVSCTYFIDRKKTIWIVLAIIAGFCGIITSFLSGSRGGWIALPLVGFFIIWQSRKLLSKKLLVAFVSLSIIVITSIVVVPQTGVQKRIDQTISSLERYYNGQSKVTSLGLRFEMWKASYYIFRESPVFGIGRFSERSYKEELVKDGLVVKQVLRFTHAHNEFINALSQRGLVGFGFLLLVYLVPLRLFLRKMKEHENNWQIKSYAMAGSLIPMCYMDFSLSQVMFGHNIGVIMYAFPIVYFWAATRWAEREELAEGKSN